MKRILAAATLIMATVLMGLAPPGNAEAPERERVMAAINYAATEWNVSEARFVAIADCESDFDEDAVNPSGKYIGLFQHGSWAGKVEAFNRHIRLHNSRHPNQQLPEMTGVWNEAIDNARMAGAMAAGAMGYKAGYGHWPNC